MTQITKPRCFLVYALGPKDLSPAEVNRRFNEFVANKNLPLVLFHDHFIGQAGGVAIFFAENAFEREALVNCTMLDGWKFEIRPLIFAHSPAAFDEQIAYTLQAYRGRDWEQLQREQRPSYGNPVQESNTASEDDSE